MQVEINNPEIQSIINDRVLRGFYNSPEAVLCEAVHSLVEQEKRRLYAAEVDRKIHEAQESIARGDFLTPDALEASLAEHKRTFMARRNHE